MSATSRKLEGAVLVLGMHRSGTSALTRGLQVLGVDLGDNLKPPVAGDNDQGFYEDWSLSTINDELLALNGGRWDSLFSHSVGGEVTDAVNALKLRAMDAIESQFGLSRFFAFKDPRTCRTVPFWRDVFARMGLDVYCIVDFRNPMSVADSLEKRDRFARAKSYYLWLLHTLSAVRDTAGMRRLFIEYDQLLADPTATLDSIATLISDDQVRLSPQALKVYQNEFLNPKWRHHVHGPAHLDLDSNCSAMVQATYALLQDEVAVGMRAADEPNPQWAPLLAAFESVGPHLDLLETFDRDLRAALAFAAGKTEEVHHLGAVIEAVRGEVAASQAETSELRAALAAAQATAQSEVAELRAALAAVQAARQAESTELHTALAAAQAQGADLSAALAAAQAVAQSESAELRRTLAEQEGALQNAQDRVQAIEASHAEYLRAADQAIDEERRESEARLFALQGEHATALVRVIEAAAVEHEQALADVRAQTETLLSIAQDESAAVRGEAAALESRLERADEERRALKAAFNSVDRESAEARRGEAAAVEALAAAKRGFEEKQRETIEEGRRLAQSAQARTVEVAQDRERYAARLYEEQINGIMAAYNALAQRMAETYGSSSWRMTKPVRGLKAALSGAKLSEGLPQAPVPWRVQLPPLQPPAIDLPRGSTPVSRAEHAPAPAAYTPRATAQTQAPAATASRPASGRRVHFTICAKNYLPIARACLETSQRHHPNAEHYLVLCDAVDQGYDPSTEPFMVIPVADVAVPSMDDMKLRYDVMELNTAIKPFCMLHFFESGADEVVYLDPDLYFLSEMSAIKKAFDSGADAVVTPHITFSIEDDKRPNDLDMLRSGVFNLGFLALKHAPDSLRFLNWWGERLRTGAVSDIQRGLFTDQKWCDLLPCFIERTEVLRHPGYNLAYWNLMHRRVERRDGRWTAAGEPIVFVHFSGASFTDASVFSKHQNRYDANAIGQLRELYDSYRDHVRGLGFGAGPNYLYTFDYDAEGRKISAQLRQLYREEMAADPLEAPSLQRVIEHANAPSPDVRAINGVTVSRLMHRIWRLRPDLQAAFDLNSEAGQRGFKDWCLHSFERECQLDERVYPLNEREGAAKGANGAATPSALSALSRTVLSNSSSLRPLYRHLPADVRQRAKTMLTRSAFSQPASRRANGAHAPSEQQKAGAALIGYARGELGMGEHVRMTAASLQTQNVPMAVINISENVLARQEDRRFDHLIDHDADFRANVFHVNADQLPIVCAELGEEFMAGKHNIAYPAWELGGFPKEWTPQLNAMDEVWAPSLFIRESLSKSIETPVVHMPLAVEMAQGYEKWRRDDFGLPGDAFVFLFYFDLASFASRKNPMGVIEAFQIAVRALMGANRRHNVILVVKVISAERFVNEFAHLRDIAAAIPGVVLMPDVFSADKIHGLVNCADAFVSLHRSEGFGRGPAEAMRLGKAAIATGYSGNMDYMNTSNSFPVGYQLRPVGRDEYPFGDGQYWAEPDIAEASAIMRRLVENPGLAREVGERARVYMAAHHSRAEVGKKYAERLRTIGALD